MLLVSEKYRDYTDNELIARFATENDNYCIAVLYERYGHLVLGLCLKYLKSREDASDAVAHIFSGLLTDLKKHKIEYFKSWLYVYSKNHCLMELRKRQSRLKKELELKENRLIFMDSEDPQHLKDKEEQIGFMEIAIEQLNQEQKRCIRLFYLEERSYSEIVGITGYSANEVKSYIQNGKRNLKIKLEALLNERQSK